MKPVRSVSSDSAVAFGLLVLALLGVRAAAAEQPNIVYILVDNWGWGDLSVQGSTVPTPRIDRFASEGIRLTNFNVQNQCTPTRSALHTGRLPIRSGTQKVAAPGEPDGLAPWEYTLAELLSDAGYSTALHGKWHVGSKNGRLPSDQGYDQWWGINEGSNAAAYTRTPQFDPEVAEIPHIWQGVKGQESVRVRIFDEAAKRMLDRETSERTIDFMRARAGENRPFFAYVGFTHFHPPWGVHSDFEDVSGSGVYSDTKMEVDHNVGLILDALDDLGIADETIVLLTGDNGAASYPSPGLVTGEVGGSNGPWRGGLSTAYEGGMRTPAMIRWPGRIAAGGVSDEIVADLDIYPTLANLVGAAERVPTDRPIDGVDQHDFLLGEKKRSNREYAVTYVGGRGLRGQVAKHEGALPHRRRNPLGRPVLHLPPGLRHPRRPQRELRPLGQRGICPRLGHGAGHQDSGRALGQHERISEHRSGPGLHGVRVMGKFSHDRFGQSGPAHSPLYQVPMQVKNATHLLFRHEASPASVDDILPEGCELTGGPAIVWTLVQTASEYPMPYTGTYVFPECTFEGRRYTFEYFLMVTDDATMAAGREFWGDSKKLCHAEVQWSGNEVFTSCQRPAGLPLVNTHFRIERQVPPEELPEMPPGLCMKMIPSSEEGGALQVHQYVEDATELVPRTDAAGRMEIYAGTGSVLMPTPTEVWPVHRIAPVRMIDAFLIRGDMDFGYGRILRDLRA